MNDLAHILGLIAGIFTIAGYVPYIYEVLTKTDVPSRASWIIWSLSTLIILFGVNATGTHEAIWVPITDALGCFAIMLLSIKYGVGGWSKTDKISFSLCVLSLVILWTTGNVLTALIMNLLIYVSGYISTIKKAIEDPATESKTAWSLFLIGVVLNFITVIVGTDRGFAVWLYPSVLVICVATLFVILFRKPKIRVL